LSIKGLGHESKYLKKLVNLLLLLVHKVEKSVPEFMDPVFAKTSPKRSLVTIQLLGEDVVVYEGNTTVCR
jgi:hypothetical protein